MNEKATSRDQRWALGLCVALVLLLVGGTLGAWAFGARRQRLAVEALAGSRGALAPVTPYSPAVTPPAPVYSFIPPFPFPDGTVQYGYDLDERLNQIAGDPPGPEWLRDWLGIDYLATVRGVTLHQLSPSSIEAVRSLTGLRSLDVSPLITGIVGTPTSAGAAGDPLIGELLNLLPRLPLLEKLTFAGASVNDDQLAMLARLPRLRNLGIIGCGQITDAGLERIGRISGLKALTLIESGVTNLGLTHIATLENLETLSIGFSNLATDAILEDLQSTGTLKELNLDYTMGGNAGGLKFLNRYIHLETLHCSGLTSDDLAAATGPPRLKTLSLVDSAQLSPAGLKHLERFPNLEEINLAAIVPGLDDEVIAMIARLPKLRVLQIQNQSEQPTDASLEMTHLSDASLESLSHASGLRMLVLCGCPDLTDTGIEHLAALKDLEHLILEAAKPNQFSPTAIGDLRTRLPKCHFVYREFSDPAVMHLGHPSSSSPFGPFARPSTAWPIPVLPPSTAAPSSAPPAGSP